MSGERLILASKSAARRSMLQNAGVEKVGLMSQPRQDGTP